MRRTSRCATSAGRHRGTADAILYIIDYQTGVMVGFVAVQGAVDDALGVGQVPEQLVKLVEQAGEFDVQHGVEAGRIERVGRADGQGLPLGSGEDTLVERISTSISVFDGLRFPRSARRSPGFLN